MSSRAEEAVIEVRDVSCRYGERAVLESVSLDVRPGEILVIMGGSGAGKSTLLRAMLGLQEPDAGSVTVLGKEITRLARRELLALRRHIGVAFQGGALLGSLSLIENVELPLRHHTKLDDMTIGIMSRMKLEMMNLAGCEDLMPSQLSGGMLKRAGLARAVAMDPKILFFDEPSAGLDPITSAELDDLILQLRDALAMTIVVITHELESALKIADRIAVLGGGRILLTGTVDEVRASEDEHVRRLLERRARDGPVDSEAYLARLTGDE